MSDYVFTKHESVITYIYTTKCLGLQLEMLNAIGKDRIGCQGSNDKKV